jgi:hypothetical protein
MALSAKYTDAYVAQRVIELQDIQTAKRLQSAFELLRYSAKLELLSHGVFACTTICMRPRRGTWAILVRRESLNFRIFKPRNDSNLLLSRSQQNVRFYGQELPRDIPLSVSLLRYSAKLELLSHGVFACTTICMSDTLKGMSLGTELARFAIVNDETSGKTYIVLSIHLLCQIGAVEPWSVCMYDDLHETATGNLGNSCP